ncbi:adhesion G protein-coupled receptor B1 [Hydra vulgaris]|uniref:adhesion G protein-coupled receptor B1 n=1 Tax=Hydra vulgaris TaxID=6087 RepID=UPI001F5F2092|nr:adhesion G protein-coupled receptor B1-like [Hydra vulgaris]
MKFVVFYSIICILEFTKLNYARNCSIGWLEHKNYCYFFHNVSAGLQGKNWTDAHMTCQRYTGNLLSVTDSEENAFVVKQLNNDKNCYWIGLNDIQNNGTYEWSDNASLLFFNWKVNSPNNQNNMDCVEATSEGWSNNFCNLSLGFICKVIIALNEQQNSCVGEINSIETINPQYKISTSTRYIYDVALQNTMEGFFCVEALNRASGKVSFQPATYLKYYLWAPYMQLKIGRPNTTCFYSSLYENWASFTILKNLFYPGYVSFLVTNNMTDYFLRNDNNTSIILEPLKNLDLYRTDASFRLVKIGVCTYTSWSNWSECSATCHMSYCENPVKTRKRFCQAGALSRDVYDFQICSFKVPCPGYLTQWSSWRTCSSTCKTVKNSQYQSRTRSCLDLYSNKLNNFGCNNSKIYEWQLCNQNVSCPEFLTLWNTWGACSASCKSSVNGPYQHRNRSCLDYYTNSPIYYGCSNSSLNEQQLCYQNVSCPAFCLEETIGDNDHTGVYTWPKTTVNQSVIKPCLYNTSAKLTRQCIWNAVFAKPEWKPDNHSFLNLCSLNSNTAWQSQQLIALENAIVTKENVVNTTDKLNIIILNGSLTETSEILRISNILKNVINVNFFSNLVINGILLAVDNLLSLNRNLIKEANQKLNTSALFLSQLNVLAEQQTSNITKAMKNIGFTSYTSSVNSKPIYIYSLEMEGNISVSISRDHPRDEYTNLNDYIILPSQLFSELSKIKVYSYIFRDNTFFEERNRKIDSVILSATISDVYVKNSNYPIKMKFSSQKSIFGNKSCYFYNVEKQTWSSEGCNTTNSTSSKTYCQCNHLTNFALMLDVYQSGNNPVILSILSRIGCIISIAGLFITIICYAAVPKLREKRAPKILIILCINLMSTLFLFVAFVERTNSPDLCKIVASMLQFFILSTFFWMAVEGFNLYRMFVIVFSNSTNSRYFLLKCSLFACGIPLIFTIATAASKTYYLKNQTEVNPKICMHHGTLFYIGIFIPVAVVMAGNILVLTSVLRSITRKSVLHSRCDCKKNVRSAFVCSLLLGTTWIFAVFAYKDARDVFQWLFCIFNSLQGFFILYAYTLQNKQVKDYWVSFIRKKWIFKKKDSSFSQKQCYGIPFEMRKSSSEEVS